MLSNLYGMVQSANIIPSIDAEIVSEIVDDTGVFCDDVIEACSKELHILDARKEKEAAGSIAPRSSRWYWWNLSNPKSVPDVLLTHVKVNLGVVRRMHTMIRQNGNTKDEGMSNDKA